MWMQTKSNAKFEGISKMTGISLERFLAYKMIKKIKEGNEKEVTRTYNHYKRRSDHEWLDKHVENLYNHYFRTKYEFKKIKCN